MHAHLADGQRGQRLRDGLDSQAKSHGLVLKQTGPAQMPTVLFADDPDVEKGRLFTAEALIEYARRDLTRYKVPKHVYFRQELPKTNVGKILRRALREELKNAAPTATPATPAAPPKAQPGT